MAWYQDNRNPLTSSTIITSTGTVVSPNLSLTGAVPMVSLVPLTPYKVFLHGLRLSTLIPNCFAFLMDMTDSSAPVGGVGEPGTPPIAPAVYNALARLENRRRSMPLNS